MMEIVETNIKEKIAYKLTLDWNQITGITDDSRQVKPGFLFCAYPGEVSDGRDYIVQAYERGAVAVLYEAKSAERFNIQFSSNQAIVVENLRGELSTLGGIFYDYPANSLNMLGVTGTNGKTSVSHLYAQVLTKLGYQAALIGTNGTGFYHDLKKSENTTPGALKLQQLLDQFRQQQVTDVAMEVSSHSLVQDRLAAIKVDTAVYTNLTQDHLDYHKTMQNYAAAKARFVKQMGLKNLIINNDDDFCKNLNKIAPESINLIRYGYGPEADVRVKNVCYSFSGVKAELITPWGEGLLEVPLLGKFNTYNLLAVISALGIKGISFEKILHSMKTVIAPTGRLQTFEYKKSLIVIDYAHTPDALKQALLTLKHITQRKLVCLFGCGGDRDQKKRSIMGNIASTFSDQVILTSDNPRNEDPVKIINDIYSGVNSMVEIIVERDQAIERSIDNLQEGDILLIAGKGHEDYQEIQNQRYYFSDIDRVKNKVEETCENLTAVSSCD